jgi:enterochelin esterase family protein
MTKTLVSPKLIALRHELGAGNRSALDTFWHEIKQAGTPLIENTGDDADYSWVTFLWRAGDEIENIIVLSQLDGSFFYVANKTLTRMLDTDLWYKTYRVRNDVRTTYRFSPNDSLVHLSEDQDQEQRRANWQPDPLNPQKYVYPADQETQSEPDIVSVLELPCAPPKLWTLPKPDVPAGQVEEFRLRSEVLNNARRVWVYTPPGYEATDTPYGLLILFDGHAYAQVMPTPTILDNLLAEHLISPLVTIMVDTPEETRYQELGCYPPFNQFLAQELVPWIHQHYQVTSNPHETIAGGLSRGGLAAAFAGLQHPEIFGKVLSQSGAFWWRAQGAHAKDALDEFEWLTYQYATSEKQPLSFYLDVGLLEDWYETPPSILLTNRHMRNVLLAKGYPVHYAEFNGGHEFLCWQNTLANGLLALVGKG